MSAKGAHRPATYADIEALPEVRAVPFDAIEIDLSELWLPGSR